MIFEAMIRDRRDEILEYLERKQFARVIDFGGAMSPWAAQYVTHYVDLQHPETFHPGVVKNAEVILADLDDYKTWLQLCEYKPFDFAICTQVIEHMLNPSLALRILPRVAREGFIGVPNKYVELYKKAHISKKSDLDGHGLSGHFRGWLPHRWVITIRDGVVWFWPKLGFVEHLRMGWADSGELKVSEELCFRWRDEIPYKMITDMELDHPTPYEAIDLYLSELYKGI